MKQSFTTAFLVSLALGPGSVLAQDKAAAKKEAARPAQVAQAGGAAATSGGASTGAVAAGGAQSVGSALAIAAPGIGITAGFAAIANAATRNDYQSATQH